MRKQTPNSFARTLDSAILSNELKGQEAAKLAGVSPGAITRWRSGQEIPTTERYLKAISDELNIDFDHLCTTAFVSKFPFLRSMFKSRPSPQAVESFNEEERIVITKVLQLIRHAEPDPKAIFLDMLETFYQRSVKGISVKLTERASSGRRRVSKAS